MKTAFFLLVFLVLASGCHVNKPDRPGFNLDSWQLAKTHQAGPAEPLYASFGPVIYDVYLNPLASSRTQGEPMPANAAFAIRVYSGKRDPQNIALTGLLAKQGNNPADARWKITAYDSANRPLPEEQVAAQCAVCHRTQDDSIVLGTYWK